MSYIKLKVRSGGIYIRQKKDYDPIDLDFIPHPENSNHKALLLIRDSSLKGLFSYLMGETGRITAIKKSKEPSVKRLSVTLDKLLKASFWRQISEPHITTFFERKDTHSKATSFAKTPSLNLSSYSFEEADFTIRLLEQPLRNIISRRIVSLSDICNFFKENVIKHGQQKEEYQHLIERAEKLSKELESKIPKANEKLKNGIKIALKRFYDKKPISKKVITLVEEIYSLYKKDTNFFQKIKNSNYGKFSVFTDLGNTTQWVDKEYHAIVRGTPSYIARVDFDIYLSKEVFENSCSPNCFSWNEVVDKLKNGPNVARWGEGGVVLMEDYDKNLNEMGSGYDQKDLMFIDVKALRHAGLKIKKYHWEEEKEKKTIKSKKH